MNNESRIKCKYESNEVSVIGKREDFNDVDVECSSFEACSTIRRHPNIMNILNWSQ